MNNSNDTASSSDPRNDPRSVDELISFALCQSEEDAAWEAIGALHWRGSREVLDQAAALCRSSCPVERELGADILGQLGVPERTYPELCVRILLEMLASEDDVGVIRAILIAFSHLGETDSIEATLPFRRHAEAEIRYAAVHALTGRDDPRAVNALIELTRDADSDVRDWATFGLGTQIDVDTSELRDALVERLSDADDDTCGEAMVGLAKRGDARVLPVLARELSSDAAGPLLFEAAALIGDPQFYPQLIALRKAQDSDWMKNLLEEAIVACSPDRAGLTD